MKTKTTQQQAGDPTIKECYDMIINITYEAEKLHEKLRIMMLETYGTCTPDEEDAE
jgi:hypothetical protein